MSAAVAGTPIVGVRLRTVVGTSTLSAGMGWWVRAWVGSGTKGRCHAPLMRGRPTRNLRATHRRIPSSGVCVRKT